MNYPGIVFAALLAALTAPCHAGQASGLVTKIDQGRTGQGYVVTFQLTNPPSGTRPNCALMGSPTVWAIDPSTPLGVDQIGLVKLAFALGKTVDVLGTEACLPSIGAEEAGNIAINGP